MSKQRRNDGGWLRQLHYADNLLVLREMEGNSVDLIYLDPPFNSNRAYNIIYGDDIQVTAFEDTWYWSPQCNQYLEELRKGDKTSVQAYNILYALVSTMGEIQVCAYLVNMGIRLIEMRRVLKDTGTIYLHCDPTASHYLKILMDCIFGQDNFRNEIVWFYHDTPGRPKKDFPRKHDIIFRYVKGNEWTFNSDAVKVPILEASKERYKYERELGGRRSLGGDTSGKIPEDVWQIPAAKGNERLGYPTQKPIALLDRIVQASCNKGDLILDPFCGCGTSIAAAEKHERQWIGIDITYSAIAAIRERFNRQKLNIWGDIETIGKPKTIADVDEKLLNKASPLYARKEFEKFCVTTINGLPNDKMGADGGIDGVIQLKEGKQAIISVKSGEVSINYVRELKGTLKDNRPIGIFITREKPTRDMTAFAKEAGIYKGEDDLLDRNTGKTIPILQIFTLKDILNGKRPILPR